MPRVYVRKSARGSWTEEHLKLAIDAYKNKNMSLREASRSFNVPTRTIVRRQKSGNLEKGPLGPSCVLGKTLENALVVHIKKLQRCGFPLNPTTVRILAFKMAETLKIKHNFNRLKEQAGRDWFKSFMDRNKHLSIRKSEGLSIARASGMNREEVSKYFQLLKTLLEENNLMNMPNRIFNVDETGLQLNNRPGKVIAVKGSKTVASITSGEKGETISLVACTSAEGTFLPPYCIFKGKNKKKEFEDDMPPGACVVMSEKSAYINSNLFMDWLENHFIPRKPSGKCLILLDGHASHMNDDKMLALAAANNIILLCLPSHSTHWLQPLDRSFFKPLKTFFYKAAENWMLQNQNRKITRMQFGKLLNEAWQKATTAGNSISGFRATGVYPFNPDIIPEEAFIESDHMQDVNLNLEEVEEESPPLAIQRKPREEGPSPSASENKNQHEVQHQNSTIHDTSSTSKSLQIPSKVIAEISPIPLLPKNKSSRKLSATHLTSPTFIKKRKNLGKKTQLLKKPTEKRPHVRQIVLEDSSDDDDWGNFDENECCGCLENYEQTTSRVDWIMCCMCRRWMHETCTKFGSIQKCDACGKSSQKKQKQLL